MRGEATTHVLPRLVFRVRSRLGTVARLGAARCCNEFALGSRPTRSPGGIRPPSLVPPELSRKMQRRQGLARIAQLVEHLVCNQVVGGSIPSAGSGGFLVDDKTKALVEACEQRIAKATDGPWEIERDLTLEEDGDDVTGYPETIGPLRHIEFKSALDGDSDQTEHDAEFVSKARTDLPEALRIIREQDAEIAKLNKEIADLSAIFGTVNAEITAEREARVNADDKLSAVDTILHAGEDVPTAEAASLVMARLRSLMDAIETRYAAVSVARGCRTVITNIEMMAYDQAVLGAKDACVRFFDDDAEI
jgi:hypothetical protein